MYGREFLDWKAHEAAAAAIDGFLADMPAEDRKWALAVLRERFEVRVEYRDSLQDVLARQLSDQNAFARHHPFDQHRNMASGGVCGANVFGSLLGG